MQSNKTRNFWLCAALLAILLTSILSHDINRPFYGLHSWAAAHGSWLARNHIKYGFEYTKGLSTWAVGDPPKKNPQRYIDHPQLGVLTASLFMRIFGVNEFSRRITKVILSVITLLLFLRILKGLLDEKTTLLAGLIYVLFPITGYFGLGYWFTLMGFSAIWCYLVLIRSLKDGPVPKPIHKLGLAVSLFLTLQFGWNGFFYAFAIGLHYVARCVFRRRMPDKSLLAILILAPLLSLTLSFTIMAGGYGWDFRKIVELYKWRSAKGEMPEFLWGAWFAKFWEFALTNFTLPILITVIVYLTLGQLFVFMEPKPSKGNKRRPRQFPQFWLFLITPVSQLLILRGALWRHQTWEHPFGPFIAIAAANGVMLLGDLLRKINKIVAYIAMTVLVAVFAIYCIIGVKHYYYIRWQAPAKIKMFKMLNQKIPPDKALLSFEAFMVNQHKSKGAHYRPEIAWYLDREIVQSYSLTEIQSLAETGKYPYYLVPQEAPLSQRTIALIRQARAPNISFAQRARFEALAREERLKEVKRWKSFIDSLNALYKYQYIPGEQGERTKDGKFLRAGMMPYLLFDLRSKVGGS